MIRFILGIIFGGLVIIFIQSELASKRGLSSMVIYNVLDFDSDSGHFAEDSGNFRKDFGFSDEDILILQLTRIVARKGIEQAIYLVKRLNMPNVKLLISHSAGAASILFGKYIPMSISLPIPACTRVSAMPSSRPSISENRFL